MASNRWIPELRPPPQGIREAPIGVLLELNRSAGEQLQECFTCDIQEHELDSALEKARSGSTGGLDVVTNGLLQAAGPEFKEQLLTVYRASWRAGVVPKNWKQAVVVPIPKVSQPSACCKDYRPISLLSALGKILEAIIKERLGEIQPACILTVWVPLEILL